GRAVGSKIGACGPSSPTIVPQCIHYHLPSPSSDCTRPSTAGCACKPGSAMGKCSSSASAMYLCRPGRREIGALYRRTSCRRTSLTGGFRRTGGYGTPATMIAKRQKRKQGCWLAAGPWGGSSSGGRGACGFTSTEDSRSL